MNFFKSCCLLAGLLAVQQGWGADDQFIVEDIRVDGLQRISAGTVFNNLPVRVGETFDAGQSAAAIRSLFQTGYFKDVLVERENNVLIIRVEERPSIAEIRIEGNEDLNSEDLLKGLEDIGLSQGKVFNRQVLDMVQQEIQRQYFARGKYGLKINAQVTPLTRNRVAILISISEGRVARIKQINIVGNQSFTDETLLEEFELSTPGWLSFYTKDDQYSKQKLSADLERLRSFYLDQGFVKFSIESTQVSISPNKREIYLTINIREGEVFTLEEVKLAGELILDPEELISLVSTGPGEIFSRQQATATSKAISDRLGDEGYVFANVNMVPDIDEDRKTVSMTFFIDPGKRVYVRRINMSGNTKTRDEVLRREMRQMEAAWASTAKIERSKVRLERLGYFEEANVETPAVPGEEDQIDVNYSVVEKSSGNLMAGLGFSQSQGLIFNANVSQDNILGTGKRVNFAFNNSAVSTVYRLGYYNPYYTVDGISRGFDLSYRETDSDEANTSDYETDVANAGVSYSIPLNEFNRLRLNIDLEHTKISEVDNDDDDDDDDDDDFRQTPQEILDFIDEEGESNTVLSLAVGWSNDTLNKAIFSTSGGSRSFSALVTVPGSGLEYYKINYKQEQYFSIARDMTIRLNGEIAYGDGYGGTDGLPFYEHYYAGGVQSVRGYEDNTLGPRDSNDDAFGGDSKLIANAEVIFPVPFIKDSKAMRMGAFFDAGNVFDSSFEIGDLRYSVGVMGKWLSPFGGITVSAAVPLNSEDGDDEQNFQFSFGSGF